MRLIETMRDGAQSLRLAIAKRLISGMSYRQKEQLMVDLAGGRGLVVAPTDLPWHVEWPEGMTGSLVANARVGLDYTHSPPRSVFGPLA